MTAPLKITSTGARSLSAHNRLVRYAVKRCLECLSGVGSFNRLAQTHEESLGHVFATISLVLGWLVIPLSATGICHVFEALIGFAEFGTIKNFRMMYATSLVLVGIFLTILELLPPAYIFWLDPNMEYMNVLIPSEIYEGILVETVWTHRWLAKTLHRWVEHFRGFIFARCIDTLQTEYRDIKPIVNRAMSQNSLPEACENVILDFMYSDDVHQILRCAANRERCRKVLKADTITLAYTVG